MIAAGLLSMTAFFTGCGDTTHSQDKINNNNIVDVEVTQINNPSGNQIFSYSGQIEESESIPLSFQITGTVKQVFVNEGDAVKKGQVLAIVSNDMFKNSYDMSMASLKQAEDAYKRLLPMYKNGNLPEVKLIEVETGLQQAKSAAAIAKKNIDDCTLISPLSGFVGKRSIEPGMNAMPGFTAINIVKIEKVYARIPVPENEIAGIKKGEKAIIKVSAIGGEEIQGTVEEIGVTADPLAHSYKIKVAINNGSHKLKPGMICSAQLHSSKKQDGLAISTKAIQIDDYNKNFVYVVDGNKAVKKYVSLGALIKDGVIINEGLSGNEKVIIAGQNRITENSIVNIVNK